VPGLKGPGDVAPDESGAVGVDAVEHELDGGGFGLGQVDAEGVAEAEVAVDAVEADQFFSLLGGIDTDGAEVGGALQPRQHIASGGGVVWHHDRDGHPLGIQRDPVAEEEQQDHRHDDGQGDAAGVAACRTSLRMNPRRRIRLAATAGCERSGSDVIVGGSVGAHAAFGEGDEGVFHGGFRVLFAAGELTYLLRGALGQFGSA